MAYPLDFSRHFLSLRESAGQPFVRRVLHPWMDRRPVPLADPAARYAALLAGSTEPRLAYVHIPFCANHCLFCGFYRNKSDDAAMGIYVDHVIREIAQDAARPGVADRPIAAVFLGGGTPSALSAEDLHRLLSALHDNLPLAPDCEITVEGRVAGFDDERVDACLAAGANRFSLGIQSFDTSLRRRMGRKASESEATAFLAGLVARERAAIVCDLIYGLPGQTDAVWNRDVSLCDDIGLDGVDLYCLTLQPDSPLALSIAKGSLPPSASDDVAEHRYRLGDATLAARGWTRLSQAHWGRTAKERNIYNRATKRASTQAKSRSWQCSRRPRTMPPAASSWTPSSVARSPLRRSMLAPNPGSQPPCARFFATGTTLGWSPRPGRS
jgi:oxygen-independent coproporphyrinogen-3 oxidase